MRLAHCGIRATFIYETEPTRSNSLSSAQLLLCFYFQVVFSPFSLFFVVLLGEIIRFISWRVETTDKF